MSLLKYIFRLADIKIISSGYIGTRLLCSYALVADDDLMVIIIPDNLYGLNEHPGT